MPNSKTVRSTADILASLSALKARTSAILQEQEKLLLEAQVSFAKGTSPDISAQAQAVLKDIQTHPGTARAEIAKRVDMKPEEVTKIVSELKEENKLIAVGQRRTTRWFTPDVLEALKKSL